MRSGRRHGRVVQRALVIALAFACTPRDAGLAPSGTIAMVSVSPPTATISVSSAVQLTATAWDSAGNPVTGSEITWATSAPSVVSVSSAGAAMGVSAGVATVTASSGTKSGSSNITVTSVSVATVTVAPNAPSVLVGTTVQLAATLRDASGNVLTGRPVTWRSSDSARARVSATGLVTGLVIGAATITATSEGRNGTASVTVTQLPVASLTLSPTSATLLIAGTRQFTATPRDAAGNPLARPVTWASSDTTKARVSGTGLVTAVAAGSASITATCETQTASALVTVNVAPVATVQVTPATSNISVNGTVQLNAVTRDANGTVLTGRVVTWSTSNDQRAQVNSTGLVLGVGAGTATITATSEGQNGTATVTVSSVPVATVTVTPPTSSIAVNGTVQLTAELKDAAGNVLTGRTVTWTSSHPTTRAQVSTTGLVTGMGTGTATITATSEGRTGTATVTVTAVPVASVTVTPATSSVAVGLTQPLTATTRDAGGNILTGRVVTWSSNSAAAQVSTAGVVLGVAVGSATITATSEGQSGTASVTVTTAPPGALANECASPGAGWIWCDDFDQDRLSSYFEYVNPSGRFTRVSGVGNESSFGMQARFPAGGTQVNAGALHLAIGRTPQPATFKPVGVGAGTANYRELYWRVYLRNQPGWTGGGGDKLTRAMIFSSSTTWAQAMIAHVWSGGQSSTWNWLVIDPASGTDEQGNVQTTEYNDFPNLRWLGADQGNNAIFTGAQLGQWHCVEVHVRLNDAGQSNGVQEMWVDGVLDASRTGLNWVGAYNQYGINAVFLENFWNNGSPAAQERYLDNFVISTARIGC